jgi:hypothetical protein
MATVVCMFKVVCVFFDDMADGYNQADAHDGSPAIDLGPGNRTLPIRAAIDFALGSLRIDHGPRSPASMSL